MGLIENLVNAGKLVVQAVVKTAYVGLASLAGVVFVNIGGTSYSLLALVEGVTSGDPVISGVVKVAGITAMYFLGLKFIGFLENAMNENLGKKTTQAVANSESTTSQWFKLV